METHETVSPEQRELIELAARVPVGEIPTAKRLLRSLIVDPVWLALQTAPLDDEPLTPEQRGAIEDACRSLDRGEGIPHEEILREFGLR